MAWTVWLAFFGAAIAISGGVRRGYWSILGLEIGLMPQLALVAVGLGAAVANSILAFHIIKPGRASMAHRQPGVLRGPATA